MLIMMTMVTLTDQRHQQAWLVIIMIIIGTMMNNNDHQGQHHHHSHHDHDEDIPGKVEVASVRDLCQIPAKPSENHIWWQPFRNYFKHIFSALFWTYIFTIFLKHNIDWYLPEQGCCLHLFLTIRNCPFF